MNKQIRYMAFLYSQLTSLITLIVLIWFLGDTSTIKSFFSYLGLPLFASKVILSIIVAFVFSFAFYKTLKKMNRSRKKNHKGETDE